MRTRTLLAGSVAALGLAVGTLAPAAAAPDHRTNRTSASSMTATAAPAYKKYVAMGDSYTAGPLIPWNSTWCFRSNNNYPAWLATDLGLYYQSGAFRDVSCSSADTTNLTQPQPTPTPEVNLATQQPQLDALTLDTDLVTLGLGGNDYGVFGSLIGCGEHRDEDPTGAPCRDHYTVNGVDTLSAALDNTGANLERSVAQIKERAPGADVVLVGYPRLLPPSGYCPDTVPFADGDYAWADSLNRKLNTVMRNAANRKGALYVDTYGPALGHDACAGDAAWVRGQTSDLLAGAAYHPNAAGMRAVSKIVLEALGGSASSSTTMKKAPAGADTEAELKKQRWARQHDDELVPTS
ncbi:SGNH/GDSL hydrolase family protein [Nocardioides sp. NPDC051685]|uniref:SGNH/GDSL hydrolase family protein n=1 Tax=Nocardioides sp. NPDC051685 TaxID=3364334 RepID=UPI0037A6E7A1